MRKEIKNMNIKQYYINRIIALENKHQQIISLICRLKIRKVEFLIGNSNYIPDEEDIEALREYFKSKAKNVNKELEQVKEKFVKADCLGEDEDSYHLINDLEVDKVEE